MYTFMRICWPVWCASMAKPVGPSHPLDATETELDCLRTVDTCTNSMILNCLCLPFPSTLSRGTNKTFKASRAVACVGASLSIDHCYLLLFIIQSRWWPELRGEWIYSSGVSQRIEHIHPTHRDRLSWECALKIAGLMTFIDSIDCSLSEIVSCVFC